VSAKPLEDVLEKEWDATLFNSQRGLAPMLGWRLCYHTLRSKGSQSGFPDRVLVRERVIFAELKREKGKPTDSQIEWLDQLAFAGAEVYLWRPSDLEEIGQILSARHRLPPYPFSGLSPRYGSAWMKSKRSDEAVDFDLTVGP
jgi:hypothetical protein